jgi:hypothetical protein
MAALSALPYFLTLVGLLTWRCDLKHGRASRAAIIPYRRTWRISTVRLEWLRLTNRWLRCSLTIAFPTSYKLFNMRVYPFPTRKRKKRKLGEFPLLGLNG